MHTYVQKRAGYASVAGRVEHSGLGRVGWVQLHQFIEYKAEKTSTERITQ